MEAGEWGIHSPQEPGAVFNTRAVQLVAGPHGCRTAWFPSMMPQKASLVIVCNSNQPVRGYMLLFIFFYIYNIYNV